MKKEEIRNHFEEQLNDNEELTEEKFNAMNEVRQEYNDSDEKGEVQLLEEDRIGQKRLYYILKDFSSDSIGLGPQGLWEDDIDKLSEGDLKDCQFDCYRGKIPVYTYGDRHAKRKEKIKSQGSTSSNRHK